MAHNKEAIGNVDPRGALGGDPAAAAREKPWVKALRLEREAKAQLAKEKEQREIAARGGFADGDDRSGNNQATLILNMRLFKFPDGTWITPRNMNAVFASMKADGYTGPWFPHIPADIPAFRDSMAYHGVWLAITEFLAGNKSQRTGVDPSIDLNLPAADSFGGFGSVGPVYQAPDEGAVKEALQGFQVAVSGQLDEGLLDQAVSEYLTVHRQDFDDKGQQHDPFQAAKTVIRSSDAYKDIHKLRKKSDDELQWVTSQQGRLRTLGLTSEQSEQLGIKLARVGANQEAAQDAGQSAFFKSTGRVAKDQRDSLKASARSVLGLL